MNGRMLIFLTAAAIAANVLAKDVDGRPIESVWANRTINPIPAMINFETDAVTWICEADGAEAECYSTTEKRMFGDWSLALKGHGLKTENVMRLRPSKPIPITNAFDRFCVWIRGERCCHGAASDWNTTPCPIAFVLNLKDGSVTNVPMGVIAWENWFFKDKTIRREHVDAVQGAAFDGFVISNVTTKATRTLHFDDIAFYKEEWKPKAYPDVMTNLSFKIREDTILPFGKADKRLKYRYAAGAKGPEFFASWDGSEEFAVFDGGGVVGLDSGDLRKPTPVLKAEERSKSETGGITRAVWRYSGTNVSAVVTYTFRVKGKSLVVEVVSEDVTATCFSSGIVSGAAKVTPFSVPYLTVGWWKSWVRPRMITAAKPGGGEARLFESSIFDWYSSGASAIDEAPRWELGEQYVRHYPKTDGKYNPLKERLFITVSPEFAEILPTIPNPKSEWKHVTGKRMWRAHALHDIEADKRMWKAVHDAGMTEVAICDHEPMWYDNGESFTFRTNTIPSKGGDAAVAAYSRYLREELGFVYGVYVNVTDYAPINAAWDKDNVARWSEGDMNGAWVRCYAPKPSLAPTASDNYPPVLKEKFGFNASYCDVITTTCPWWRTDYDHRVPGAGKYAPVYHAYCETLVRHKRAFNGPVWSEGRQHMMYAGFADGSYAQCGNLREDPWIVDFDLVKIHPLCCDFGMGCLSMYQPPKTREEAAFYIPHAPTPKDREILLDRFIGATLAYGHAGYLVPDYLFDPPKTFGLAFCGPGKWTGSEEGWRLAKRSYFMVQQIAARYTQSDVKAIRYPDADGKLHATSEAMFLKLPARRPTLSATSAGDGKTPLQQKLRVNSGSDKSPIV